MNDPTLTPEELARRQLLLGEQNKAALLMLQENTNFEDLGGITAASGAVAQIMAAASATEASSLTIGLESRGLIVDIMGVCDGWRCGGVEVCDEWRCGGV